MRKYMMSYFEEQCSAKQNKISIVANYSNIEIRQYHAIGLFQHFLYNILNYVHKNVLQRRFQLFIRN
jgi:hypothetical protein